MANRPTQTLSLAPSSDAMNGIIFSQLASQPTQNQALRSPPKPASPKGAAAQTTPSKSLVSRLKNNVTPRPPRPHLSSTPPAPPEDHTFMPATRHALEQALGKASLDRHEVLLQQDKKHTQDYIAQLEDVVKEKASIAPSTQESLLRREITMWKVKAQELDESAKTEMQLLRECNGRVKEEMIAVRAVAEGLRTENEGLRKDLESLREENGRLREMQKFLREEDKERMTLVKLLEGEKEELQRVLNSVVDENDELKGKAKNLEEEVKKLSGVAKGTGGVGESKDGQAERRKVRNLKRRARDKKRRDQVLVKENMELAAKLAEVEGRKNGTCKESLEVEDKVWEGFQGSDEGGEMMQEKDEAVSDEKRKSKKKKGKREKKVTKEEQ